MLNPIKEIYSWQKAAGNLEKPYDDFLESSFQIEEALEGFNSLEYLGKLLTEDEMCTESDPKILSRMIVNAALEPELSGYEDITDVDRLDKACDAIVYAIGSIAKLGLDHHGITKALNIVNAANKQKLNSKRDNLGKLEKPLNFKGPEEELQKLLDSYKKGH